MSGKARREAGGLEKGGGRSAAEQQPCADKNKADNIDDEKSHNVTLLMTL